MAGPANIRFGLQASFAAFSRPLTDCLAQAGLSSARLSQDHGLPCARRSERAHRTGSGPTPEAPVPPRHDHHRRACRLRRRASRAAMAASSWSAPAASAGPNSAAGNIGSAAGARSSPTRAAAPGSAAKLLRPGAVGLRRSHRKDRRCSTKHSSNFIRDPHAIVRWASKAAPRDFGALAPLVVEHATRGDAVGRDLMQPRRSSLDALGGAPGGPGSR